MTDKVIKLIKTVSSKDKAILEKAICDVESGDFEKRQNLFSEYKMIQYKSYIKAGFTKEQALELIK